jgi:VWFA-related protein
MLFSPVRHGLKFGLTLACLIPVAPVSGQVPSISRPEVLVDFLAIGRDGQPVTDLRAEDLTLRIDGRTRPVKSLRLVQVGAPPADPNEASTTLAAPYGSNDGAEFGRNILIVIEDESILAGSEQDTKEALGAFINRLSRRDRVGLVTVPHGGQRVGLTTDHSRVRQALSLVYGRGARGESDADAACRSRETLQSIASLLSATRADDGPLVVVFFSASMIGGRGAEAPAADIVGSGLQSRRCELNPEEFRRVAVQATGARAYFYIVQPETIGVGRNSTEPTTSGGAIPRWDSNPRAGLEHLAGVTGGRVFQLAGSDSTLLNRVGVETSAFYLAAVEADANDRTESTHQLSVRTARGGVTVYARPDILLPKAVNAGLTPVPGPAHAVDLLLQARVYRDLPLRGIGFPSRTQGDNIMILSLLESLDRAATLKSAAMGMYNSTGQLVAQWAARDTEVDRKVIAAGLSVPTGTYRLRVAAIDTAGRAGTADYEVAAELTPAGPLKMSALVLGLWRNGAFEPRLQFANEPVAMAYVELYGRPPGTGGQVALAFELATTLNGPALLAVPGVVSATTENDKFIVNAAIPIGALPPGDFIVRAIVGLEDQPAGRVYRIFRKGL